jgi:acetoin utilization deacetylase AcuC-like enzyme
MSTGLFQSPLFADHDTGPGHPENAARHAVVTRALAEAGWTQRLAVLPERPAEWAELERCHSRRYIELVRAETAVGRGTLSTGDTQFGPRSLEVALQAVGGVLGAVDAVLTGVHRRAFCAVRPPGHHANAEKGMGFCIFNNVALAARHAQRRHGADKIAIVDWDVHHGNGTQDIFYEDGSVLFFSTHQSPWYPFTGHEAETGAGSGRGTTFNCPLAAGAGMAEVGAAFDERLLPALEGFQPDLILISAGFDSREQDPLGRFRLTDADFVRLTGLLKQAADSLCGGRLISVLEGGYHLEGLASAVVAHVGELAAG